MRRASRAPLIAAAALVVLIASSRTGAGELGELGGGSGVGRPPRLPKPLGPPPSSSPSSPSAAAAVKAGPAVPMLIDVSSPTSRVYSRAELDAMRARIAARQPAQSETLPAASPAGSVRASPELEPRHGSTPAGYNPAQARARAPAMARHLATKGPKAYSRTQLQDWQRFAGLRVDGVYAGSTRGALVFYGVKDPPRPFAQPVATLPYHPPDVEP